MNTFTKNRNPNTMNSDVTYISTAAGELHIWEERGNRWSWSTPNGSEGRYEKSFDAAVQEAFDAQGLKAADYGY
jgi:hypothetical protein